MFIDFREEGEGREAERKRERDLNVREKHRSDASRMWPDPGSNPQPFGVWDDVPTH